MTMPLDHRYRVLLDRMGAVGSLLCAVHCALLPLLIALLPSIGVATWLSKDAEEWFVVFASMVGLFSVVWGYRRHREVRALGLLLPGLAALWFGVLYAPLHATVVPHAIVMTLGGTFVALAHVANLRLTHLAAEASADVG